MPRGSTPAPISDSRNATSAVDVAGLETIGMPARNAQAAFSAVPHAGKYAAEAPPTGSSWVLPRPPVGSTTTTPPSAIPVQSLVRSYSSQVTLFAGSGLAAPTVSHGGRMTFVLAIQPS